MANEKKKTPHKAPFEMEGEEIRREVLPNGDPSFEVTVGYSNIKYTSTYSQNFLSILLAAWFSAFYDAVRTGGSLENTPFKNFKIKPYPSERKKDDEEIDKILSFYALRASLLFEHALPQKLADFTAQLLAEVIISTVLDMEENGVLTIEGNRIDVWDDYLTDLKVTLKRRWNSTISRGAKFWSPVKRSELLKVYEWALMRLQFWHHTYHSSGKVRRKRLTNHEWKEAKQEWPTLVPYLKKLPNETPHQLALKYAMEVIRFKGETYLRKQLTLARKEKEKSSNK